MIADIKKIYSLMIVGLMVAAGGLVVANTIDDVYAKPPTSETIDGWTYVRISSPGPEVLISEYVGPPMDHLTVPSSLGSNIVTELYGLFLHNVADTVRSVTISDGIKVIGQSAFKDCSVLADITIPDSVTSIGGHAFRDCPGLTSITIPDSVTSIGGHAFSGCSGLTSITIPDSVTVIQNGAFYNCTSLTSVVLPNNSAFEKLQLSGIFDQCTSLKSITVPDKIQSLLYNVSATSYLESITILGNPGWATDDYGNSPPVFYTVEDGYLPSGRGYLFLTDVYVSPDFTGDHMMFSKNLDVLDVTVHTLQYVQYTSPSPANIGITGAPYMHQLSNTPGVSVTISEDSANWLTSLGGKISGTPPSDGVYEITVTLSAPGHLDVTETFTLTVVPQLALMNKPSAGVIAYAVS